MSEWVKYRIEDVSSYMADAPFGSNLKTKDYIEEGELVIQGKNIDGRRMRWDDFRYVSREKYDSLKRHQANLGAIVFPKVGTIGKVGILTQYQDRENYLLSTNTMMFEPDLDKTTSLFVYYFFANPRTRRIIEHSSTSSVQPVFNFTALKNFEIELPPLPEQKAIAHILGKLDDKIELNHKMNETLEGMAQALFKSWFVDFDPVLDNALANGNKIPDALHTKAEQRKAVPDHSKLITQNPKLSAQFPDRFEFNETLNKWIPEGWEVKRIDDCDIYIADYVANGSFASLKQNVTLFPEKKEYALFMRNTDLKSGFKKKVFVDKHSYEFLKKTKLKGGEIIISNVGDVGSVYRCPDLNMPMTLGNNVIMLNSEFNNYLFQYFSGYLGQGLIDSIKGGSAQPKFNKTDFKSQSILIPNTQIMKEFERMDTINRNKQESLKQENGNLAKLRDTLLPQLISGKVRVPEEVVERFGG